MKVLILGATGFLGSILYQKALEDESLTVVGTSRLSNVAKNVIPLDVMDKHLVAQTIASIKPDVVIWCLMSMENEDQLIEIGLKNVVTHLSEDTKFIFLSTDAVFVDGRGDYDELDSTGLLPSEARLAIYVNAKYAGEQYLTENYPNHVIVRTGPLYGDNHYIEKRTLQIIENMKESKSYNAWENVFRSFVNVQDLSDALLELTKNNVIGTLHAGPPQKESYYTFNKKRVEQLGFDSSYICSVIVTKDENPYISLDTSLRTDKISELLPTVFRNI
ncbi:MAG: sugar nucleotide-binding protein [Psychrobacillus sp.]